MRIPVSFDRLAAYVCEELQARTTSCMEFTAYEVTCALRERLPHLDIEHGPVRDVVHTYMGELLVEGAYRASLRRYRTGMAVLYEPERVPLWPRILGLPYGSMN